MFKFKKSKRNHAKQQSDYSFILTKILSEQICKHTSTQIIIIRSQLEHFTQIENNQIILKSKIEEENKLWKRNQKIPANQASECFQDFHPHHFACIDVIHESAAYRTKNCLFVFFLFF